MHRKLVRLCIVLSLALTALGAVNVPSTFAAYAPCDNPPGPAVRSHGAGIFYNPSGTLSMERTQSFIAISNSGHFGPCSTGTGLFQDDGAFASVGIWKESNSNQRIEIGIVSCADASYGFCRGKGNYNYFASYGDDSNVRHYVNLGSAGNAEGVWNHFKIAKVDATTWKGYVNTTQISYTFPYSSIDGWVNGGTTSFWTNDWEDGGDSIGHNSSTGARTRFLTMRMRTEGGVDISPFDADGRNFTDPCTLSQNGGGGYQVDSGQNNHWCDIIAYDEFHSWSTG